MQEVAIRDWFNAGRGYSQLEIQEAGDTADLFEIFMHFIDVQSVCSPFEGQRTLNPFRQPLKRENFDESIPFTFLKMFLSWLEAFDFQKISTHESFTTKTKHAAIQCTRSTIAAIQWSFENVPEIDFILLGKWTQDAEEHFFGKLRHVSSRHFHSSPLQFKESLRKLRDRRLLGWISEENETQLLKGKKIHVSDQTATNEAFEDLLPLLESDYFDEEAEKLDPETQHVAGYAAAKLVKGLTREPGVVDVCKECVAVFVAEKGGGIIDNNYHNYLQRGGLTVATPFANLIANHLEVFITCE